MNRLLPEQPIKGVTYHKKKRKWRARFRGRHLGWFKTVSAANQARRDAEAEALMRSVRWLDG